MKSQLLRDTLVNSFSERTVASTEAIVLPADPKWYSWSDQAFAYLVLDIARSVESLERKTRFEKSR